MSPDARQAHVAACGPSFPPALDQLDALDEMAHRVLQILLQGKQLPQPDEGEAGNGLPLSLMIHGQCQGLLVELFSSMKVAFQHRQLAQMAQGQHGVRQIAGPLTDPHGFLKGLPGADEITTPQVASTQVAGDKAPKEQSVLRQQLQRAAG